MNYILGIKIPVFSIVFISILMLIHGLISAQNDNMERPEYTVILHGGAGSYSPDLITPERREIYESIFTDILRKAESMLKNGATSVEVVEACIIMMEDDSLFNAGKGAVFTAEGKHTLDASIMDGKTKEAGGVAGLRTIKNPIRAAKMVLDSSVHVLLSGEGADEFSAAHGLEQVDNGYFDTVKGKEGWLNDVRNSKHGTVGCVVLDSYGNLASGTSTGGMSMKRYGRIGDSPIIGAGTYADNETCAISCTGHGELFIRYAVAYDLHARMKYQGNTLGNAASDLLLFMNANGINGGFIALDKKGNSAKIFNTHGMLTGQLNPDGISIKIYQNEIINRE